MGYPPVLVERGREWGWCRRLGGVGDSGNTGGNEDNPGGSTGGDPGGSAGGNTGGNTGGNPGGNAGGTGSSGASVYGSDENNGVKISVSIFGKTAVIEPLSEEQLDQVLEEGKDGGNVVIDLSALGGGVDGVEISTQTLYKIETESIDFVVKLPTGTLSFDSATVSAILEQAAAEAIRIHLEDVGTDRLNEAQKKALRGKDVRKGFEAHISVNNKRISDFKGGKAQMEVSLPRTGKDRAEGFSVWFVGEDGSLEKLNSSYDGKTKSFAVGHFSDYVIIYEDEIVENFRHCSQDENCLIHGYADLKTDAWYHDGVHYCLENNLMVGYGENRFAAEGKATRAMVITMLWRLNGSPVMSDTPLFTDTKEGAWYTEAVRWARAVGITKGYGDGRFGVNDSVTREQLAVFLYQYVRYKGYNVSGGDKAKILSYSDIFDVNEYAIHALQWACGNGIINGVEVDGEILLLPGGFASRAQLATMMMRLRTEVTA